MSNYRKNIFLSASLVALSACLANHAGAQAVSSSSQPTNGPSATTASGIEEVVVTAEKHSERALEVPGAITAFSGDALLNSGDVSIKDFAGLTPGLQFNSNLGTGAPVVRGITEGLDTSPTVAVVVDGAPMGSSSSLTFGAQDSLDLNPIDVAQVEVLKGPQGTLYGADTLGGLLNYSLREPDLSATGGILRGQVDGTEHGGASYSVQGAVSIPLVTDQLAVRASGFYDDDGGFIDNDVRNIKDQNTRKSWGLRGAVLYQPTSRLSIELNGFYQDTNARADDTVLYNFATHKPLTRDLHYDDYYFPANKKTVGVGLATIKYDFGWANLTSITSVQEQHAEHDLNGTYGVLAETIYGLLPLYGGPVFPTPPVTSVNHFLSTRKTTEELHLSSPDDQPLTWIVGGYYSFEKNTYNAEVIGRTTTGAPASGLDPAFALGLFSSLEEYSAFGDLTYKFSDLFDVTGGLRVGEINQSYTQTFFGSSTTAYNAFLTSVGAPIIPAATPASTTSTSESTYLATARYHFSPDGIIFIRYATGFRPGGPNLDVNGLPATFQPDKTINYEAGIKSLFWDGRGSIDITGYLTDWRSILVAVASPSGVPGYTSGGNARVSGIEAAASLRPIDGLTFNATLGYSSGKITEASAIAATSLAKGDPLPDNPKFSGSLSAEYRWTLDSDWSAYVNATDRYSGSRNSAFKSSAAFPNYVLPSYNLLDLHAGAETGNYTLDVFVKNIADERAQLGAQTGNSLAEVTVARPRTIGIALTANY